MLIDDVIAQLKTEVAAFENRVEGAAELSALVAAGKWPQRTPAAWVLPLGFDQKGGESVAGMFTAMLSRGVGVVMFNRASGDATGGKSLPTIETLETGLLGALAGWQPASVSFGVLLPVRSRLISVAAGAVIHQIDFSIDDQLRIARA